MTDNTSRIKAIQGYANRHGFALALRNTSGSGTSGYNDCTPQCQSWILDNAADYLLSITDAA